MSSRLDDIPVYAQRPDRVDARLYNLWRRARQRASAPLRLPLPGLAGLELVLEEHAWVCVDTHQNNVPVLAWVDFKTGDRSALHTPVECSLNHYHFAASRLRAQVLNLMEEALEAGLRSGGSNFI